MLKQQAYYLIIIYLGIVFSQAWPRHIFCLLPEKQVDCAVVRPLSGVLCTQH